MRFKLRKKILAIASSYEIHDENDNLAFVAKGKLLSFGDHITVTDPRQQTVFTLRQKVFAILPTYRIAFGDGTSALVKQRFSFFRKRFSVVGLANVELTAQGSLFDYEYEIADQGNIPVATVSKKFFALSDTYGIDIHDDRYQHAVIACNLVISLVRAKQLKKEAARKTME
jgi:uncharacterized protein YxjI